MSRAGRTSLIVAAGLAAAAGVSACGSDGGDGGRLSRATASELRSTLNRVEQDVTADDCDSATEQARALVVRAGDLPDSVDADLREALVAGADRLEVLVTRTCSTSSTGPTGPTESGATAETGPSGATGEEGKQEKPKKPGKKGKGPKHEQSGPPGQDQSGSTGGDGLDKQDSGGVAP